MQKRSALLIVLLVGGCIGALAETDGSWRLGTSNDCRVCHTDIYRTWRASAHANAFEDPIFQDAYRETVAREGQAAGRDCLKCHAPMVELNNDLEFRQKVTWEGVTCDICHSVKSLDESKSPPTFGLDVGPVKRGPIKDVASMAHEVAYSDIYTKSSFCAPCHEYVTPAGVSLMSTYSEWRASKAAKDGVTCQSCHMGRTRGAIVDPKMKRVPGDEINLHDVPAGHSLAQLHKAVGVTFTSERVGDDLKLAVQIVNKGAGHAVPTGMPGRRIILDVSASALGGKLFSERRTYGRTFVDAKGVVTTTDLANFAKGARPKDDTRLKPDERRVEEFLFPIPASATANVEVRMHYEHSPTGDEAHRTFLTFFSESRSIAPK